MSDATALPLLAQLTYTSLESSSGGGWQVKEQRGRIADEDLQTVLGRIPTRLPAPQAGRFVTADEVSSWPRRLTHQVLRSAAGEPFRVLVNSVSAGQDRSGRSGNVFSHCAVPATGSQDLPIQTWQSSSWLTPFGPEAVRSATLGGDQLELSVMLADEVAVFLAEDENDKLQILALLLDALHAALTHKGPTVALLVQDTEEAAAWIKAVSLCMATRTAARFVFSTCESVGASDSWNAEGFHLVCLLPDAREALNKIDGIVVVDASSPVGLGVRDADPHRTARGDQVLVTLWSELMFEIIATFSDLRDFRSAMVELERRIPGEDSSDPAWWMAMLTYTRGGSALEAGVVDIVARVAPSGVASGDDMLELVRGALLTTMGRTTAERFTKLLTMIDAGLTPYMQRLATAAYVESACADPEWLAGAEEVLPPTIDDVPLTQEMVATMERLPKAIDLSTTDRAIAGVRFLELTQSLGWQDQRGIASPRETLSEQWVAPALRDGAVFTGVMHRLPRMQPETLNILRQHAFTQADEKQLDPHVLEGLDLLDRQGLMDPSCSEAGGDISALGMQVVRETWRRAHSPEEKKPLVALVVLAAAQAIANRAPDMLAWRALEAGVTLDPLELTPIIRKWHKSVSPDVIVRTMLASSPDASGLDALLSMISNSQGFSNYEVAALAEALALLQGQQWKHPSSLTKVWDTIKKTYSIADDHKLPVPVQYRQAMKVMAVCAMVAWPEFSPQPKELTRLVQTNVPTELIEEAIPLFVGTLRSSKSQAKTVFPYMARQELLTDLPSRALLLGMRDKESSLSEVERLIKAWFERKQVSEEALLGDLREWVETVVNVGPVDGRDRWAKDIEKSVLSWFRKNVRTKDGLSARLWKGLAK